MDRLTFESSSALVDVISAPVEHIGDVLLKHFDKSQSTRPFKRESIPEDMMGHIFEGFDDLPRRRYASRVVERKLDVILHRVMEIFKLIHIHRNSQDIDLIGSFADQQATASNPRLKHVFDLTLVSVNIAPFIFHFL